MLISVYPMAYGAPRELRAEANIAAVGPFDSPPAIAGRFISPPTAEEIREILPHEVLFEGEVYAFHRVGSDGSFEMVKAQIDSGR